ncbi:MAG: zinc-ribbon domain-containing protein [Chloroflexi bacterium]|jgi:ribosomal protein L40E|nr:zinc-ribbon domain-containing protein [Chloroflexota bacterium]
MARKELGYVELEWTCPNCKTRNPGLTKTCQSCGAPQPADVEFQSKADEQLLQEEAKIQQAAKGPDIHCGFCGARNAADAVICSQCGGDLKQGKARQAGKELGGFQEGTSTKTKCPHCAAENPANAQICSGCGAPLNAVEKQVQAAGKGLSKGCLVALGIAGLLVLIGVCSLLGLSMKKTDMTGILNGMEWKREIAIEVYGPVEKSDWRDNVPSGAIMGSCSDRVRGTSSSYVPNSVEVCGEPYKVDKGNGVAEVVQDCEYEVHDDYCDYTINEWHGDDPLVATGSGPNAIWPPVTLSSDQREGRRSENYSLIFKANGDQYRYETQDYAYYRQAVIGSEWKLTVNGLGSVVSAEPLK